MKAEVGGVITDVEAKFNPAVSCLDRGSGNWCTVETDLGLDGSWMVVVELKVNFEAAVVDCGNHGQRVDVG